MLKSSGEQPGGAPGFSPDTRSGAETNEQRYWDALHRTACYMSAHQLRLKCEKLYGLEFDEALEMAYESIIADAKLALGWRRRPRFRARTREIR